MEIMFMKQKIVKPMKHTDLFLSCHKDYTYMFIDYKHVALQNFITRGKI